MAKLMKMKEIIKNNSVISTIYYKLRTRHYELEMSKFHKIPIENKTILFNNFNGKGFGDNPRAIAEKMHELAPEYCLKWTYADKKALESLPEYLVPVRFGGEEYYKSLATAAVWIFNVVIPEGIKKKEGQLYIQTWHGDRGFKKVANDALDNDKYKKNKQARKIIENDFCDFFVTGSKFAEKTYRSAFGYSGELLKCGTPRNDCLVTCNNGRTLEIKKELSISENTYVVLYAPTFRGAAEDSHLRTSNINLDHLVMRVEAVTGKTCLCLLRAHGGTEFGQDYARSNSCFLDVTEYPDMADLLMVTDMLITDYSSSAGDFLLTGRPVILYQDDIESYIRDSRNLYFKMEDSGYWIAHSQNELDELITTENLNNATQNDAKVLDFYGAYESGESSRKICDVILQNARR